MWLTALADAQLAAGRAEDALVTIETAFATAEQTRERWMNAELWRVKACVLSRADRQWQEEAETCFRQALACAEKQQSKMLALRTATSLAESWASRGLRSEAHEQLASRYRSFSEGFDTPDLRQAKRLMDALQ